MEVIAKANNLRMSARKVRLVADLVRGMDATPALSQLQFMAKAASTPVEKLLKSAMANAEHNFRFDKDSLYIKTIKVDMGMPLKRWRARAFGRAAPIIKHGCHITLILESRDGKKLVAEEVKKTTKTIETATDAQVQRDAATHQHAHNEKAKSATGTQRRVFNRKAG